MASPPTSQELFNPFRPEVLRDPYPFYRRLRAEAPIHYSYLGVWLVSRYDDAVTVLKDSKRCRDANRGWAYLRRYGKKESVLPPAWQVQDDSLFYVEGQTHALIRDLAWRTLSPTAIAQRRPRVMELTRELFERAAVRGEMELAEELAEPLPMRVIFEVLGVPDALVARMEPAARTLSVTFELVPTRSAVERANAATEQMKQMFAQLLAERRREPAGDLISALAATDGLAGLSDKQIVSNCILMCGAGMETTASAIVSGVKLFLQQPDMLKRLRADPALIPAAVEEVLRLEAPVQAISRTALTSFALGDQTIDEGDELLVLLGSANRDEARFAEPDEMLFDRPFTRNLSFGFGLHHCIGSVLARLELQIVLELLVGGYELTAVDPQIEWREGYIFRRPKTLRVQVRRSGLV